MANSSLVVLGVVALCGCNPLHRGATADEAGTPTSAESTPVATTTVNAAPPTPVATTATGDKGDEASARALLTKFLAAGDRAALTKPLRPTKADYTALFDPPTAAKLQPQYDQMWDKEPMVLEPKAGQTALKLWAATSEDLQTGKGNVGEFPGGWKKVAPHLTAHQTWYRFKFVKPGEDMGMAFDGLTFVNGHWVITPKPWHGL